MVKGQREKVLDPKPSTILGLIKLGVARYRTQLTRYVICYGMLWHIMVCMITNNESHGNNKTKRTAAFNHSLAMYHVVLAERKLTSYVYAVGDGPAGEVGALQFWYQSKVFLPSSFTVLPPAPQF
ncbi:hypothetical protein TIFTF001_045205 [Ficus carica]|uniref:Uncharacterized protein n=1 Tax=Ficus carica TaxID=3494 RepID=A0AA88CH93_FICCA|nr:hypothetical protein TIFTF001_045205 [Ficus carica]